MINQLSASMRAQWRLGALFLPKILAFALYLSYEDFSRLPVKIVFLVPPLKSYIEINRTLEFLVHTRGIERRLVLWFIL